MSELFKLSTLRETNSQLAVSFLWTYDNWQGADGDDLYVHLGCGDKVLEGFLNLDFIPQVRGVKECHMLHVWPERLIDRIRTFYAEDLIEHFFLSEQLYILCSMNCLLNEQGVVRLLMPDISQLWSYGRGFDLETLRQSEDYFVTTMRCRNGMDAVNMGMRMGGHRWLHNFASFRRVAEACGFAMSRTTCGSSSDLKMTGINIRDESGISFAVELFKKRRMGRILVSPSQVLNAELIEDLGEGQQLYRATDDDPKIIYRFPALEVGHLALMNVRSANLSEFREHNFAKAYFLPSEAAAIYVDRSLSAAPYMNIFSQVDILTALSQEHRMDRLRFDPSERRGDYFTVGPLELFTVDHDRADTTPTESARSASCCSPLGETRDHRSDHKSAPKYGARPPISADLEAHIIEADCRYGTMAFFDFDGPIGLALSLYGEWAQNEIGMLRPYVPAGGVVVDVGANVGTHTLAFASFVGETGKVIAIEPQPDVHALLRRNVVNNGLDEIVRSIPAGAASGTDVALVPRLVETDGCNLGTVRLSAFDPAQPLSDDLLQVEVVTLDGLGLDRLDFLKIDAEGAEADALRGAGAAIASFRPVVSVECAAFSSSWPVVEIMSALDYTAFFIQNDAFNNENFLGTTKNIFGAAQEGLLLFLPQERLTDGAVPNPQSSAVSILAPLDLVRALFGMITYSPSSVNADGALERHRSDLLDETLLALKSKRGDELCVSANKTVRRLHRKVKSMRAAVSSLSFDIDGSPSVSAVITAMLEASAPVLPVLDEPADHEPWPTAPRVQDWADLAKRMHSDQSTSTTNESASNDPVDVIIPVYRGQDQTLACLYAVMMSTSVRPFHLIVIDDASPEPELSDQLQRLSDLGLIQLIQHAERRGFVASANEGMRLSTCRDVVLLNSDTVVYNDWLDRLRIYVEENIDVGTVTPLSNNATICSYPVVERNNRASIEISPAELDRMAARVNAGIGITIPTGIGFCMYIRRACLDAIGFFDEEAFGLGYGEENDFCMRASSAGWRNAMLASVFVRHAGAASFGKKAMVFADAGLETVKRLHPSYEDIVAAYCAGDESRGVRRALDRARLERAFPEYAATMLLVTHDWGGGVERHVQDLSERLAEEGVRVLLLRPFSRQSECLWGINLPQALHLPNLAFELPRRFDDFLEILVNLDIQHIHVHSFAGFAPAAPAVVRLVADILSVTYDFTVHDYAALCPNIHLVDRAGKACDAVRSWRCRTCVDSDPPPLLGRTEIGRWRKRYAYFLSGARRIIAPSRDARSRMAEFFPGCIERMVVRPHPENEADVARKSLPAGSKQGDCSVVVIGAIGPHKGAELLLACAQDARSRRLPLSFRVIGYTCLDEALHQAGIITTGGYVKRELAARLAEAPSEIAFFPSVWPETYSYTLSEAVGAGLFPVCFDLGAPAERIRDWGWGHLLPARLKGSAAAVNDALLDVAPSPLPRHLARRLFNANQYNSGLLNQYYGFGPGHPLYREEG